jgi:transcriptional regulator with XRE-family HTH domain
VDLSTRIRELRYAKGWGPRELARHARISRTAICQIERRQTSTPQAETLRKIASALGVPSASLCATVFPTTEDALISRDNVSSAATPSVLFPGRDPSSERAEELFAKFRLLLGSPLAEGVAQIVEESFRLLPIIPPQILSEPDRYARPVEFKARSR